MFLNKRVDNYSLVSKTITQADNSPAQSLDYAEGFCIVESVTDATPGIKTCTDTDVNPSTDTITITANGYTTGLKLRVSSTGTLPAGLAAATDYFVIVVTANTFKLASSLSNANAGTAIDITTSGTAAATITFTCTALAGATVKLQGTLDGTTWADIANSSTSITGTTTILWNVDAPYYSSVRVVHAMTAGMLTVATNVTVKAFT